MRFFSSNFQGNQKRIENRHRILADILWKIIVFQEQQVFYVPLKTKMHFKKKKIVNITAPMISPSLGLSLFTMLLRSKWNKLQWDLAPVSLFANRFRFFWSRIANWVLFGRSLWTRFAGSGMCWNLLFFFFFLKLLFVPLFLETFFFSRNKNKEWFLWESNIWFALLEVVLVNKFLFLKLYFLRKVLGAFFSVFFHLILWKRIFVRSRIHLGSLVFCPQDLSF